MTGLNSPSMSPATEPDPGALALAISSKLIDSVDICLEAFLGSARLTVAELVELKEGAVVALDAPLNQNVELRLNGLVVAAGELVAVGDNFGIRLTAISR